MTIGPYKFINSNDDLSTKDCKSRRSLAVRVLNSLIKTAVDVDMIQNQRQVGVENSAVIFDFAYRELMRKLYPNQPDKRGGDLVLCAVYERLRKVDRADVDRLANEYIKRIPLNCIVLINTDSGCIKQFDVNLE